MASTIEMSKADCNHAANIIIIQRELLQNEGHRMTFWEFANNHPFVALCILVILPSAFFSFVTDMAHIINDNTKDS